MNREQKAQTARKMSHPLYALPLGTPEKQVVASVGAGTLMLAAYLLTETRRIGNSARHNEQLMSQNRKQERETRQKLTDLGSSVNTALQNANSLKVEIQNDIQKTTHMIQQERNKLETQIQKAEQRDKTLTQQIEQLQENNIETQQQIAADRATSDEQLRNLKTANDQRTIDLADELSQFKQELNANKILLLRPIIQFYEPGVQNTDNRMPHYKEKLLTSFISTAKENNLQMFQNIVANTERAAAAAADGLWDAMLRNICTYITTELDRSVLIPDDMLHSDQKNNVVAMWSFIFAHRVPQSKLTFDMVDKALNKCANKMNKRAQQLKFDTWAY
eukprot:2494460-Rhodomonas_salina.2